MKLIIIAFAFFITAHLVDLFTALLVRHKNKWLFERFEANTRFVEMLNYPGNKLINLILYEFETVFIYLLLLIIFLLGYFIIWKRVDSFTFSLFFFIVGTGHFAGSITNIIGLYKINQLI